MKIATILGEQRFIPGHYFQPFARGGMSMTYQVDAETIDKVTTICHFDKPVDGDNLLFTRDNTIEINGQTIVLPIGKDWGIPYSCSEYSALQQCVLSRNIVEIKMRTNFHGPVFAVTEDNDLISIIRMEYVRGKSLKELRLEGNLSVKDFLYAVHDISLALEDLAQRGIIHCDVKPTNIILGKYEERTRATLIDFGIATCKTLLFLPEELQDTVRSKEKKVREMRLIIGTPHYMSPEQVNREEITPKSDLFSLGLIICYFIMKINNNIISRDSTKSPDSLSNPPNFEFSSLVDNPFYFLRDYTKKRKEFMDIIAKEVRRKQLPLKAILDGLESVLHEEPEQRNSTFLRECAKRDLQRL